MPVNPVRLHCMTKRPDLRDPATMLATLRLAYRYALDRSGGDRRLSAAQERELGRRLALYWDMDPKPTAAERTWHRKAKESAMIRGLRRVAMAVHDDGEPC